jgi:hypothetical protein
MKLRYRDMRALKFIFLFVASTAFAQCDEVDSLNQKIISLANEKIGKKVDRGECWDLAAYVLNETGCEWDGLYEFGTLLSKDACLMPGDIIQFKGVVVKYQKGRTKYTEAMTHHTAIIQEVKSKDEVVLIHQNTAYAGRKVTTSPLVFSTITKGSLKIYRPRK